MPDYHSDEFLAMEREYARAYSSLTIKPTDYIYNNKLGWHEGNVIKYVSRWKFKGGLEDLYKAKDYLEQLIAIHDGSQK